MYKIRKIIFKNHRILKNLSLDFCDSSGCAVDTVILAGENGTGKSSIINALFQIANHRVNFECLLEIEKDGEVYRLDYHFRPSSSNDHSVFVKDNKGNDMYYVRVGEKYPFSAIYSDVDINFHADSISSVTSLELDSVAGSRRSSNDLPKQINQLLIDIQALDDAEVARMVRDDNSKRYSDMQVEERMPRFTNAFAKMFDDLSYSRIINRNNKKTILFQKNGVDIPIEGLSSGEKQVVYRGCFLLKDINAINGAFVFIDEPEISLHPDWQSKIMDYYKGIFTNSEGIQTSQIFTVTHSPFVIHNENRKNDKIIVLSRNDDGEIVVLDKPEYYRCTSVEAVKDAFSIDGFSSDKSTVYLEGRTDEKYFNKALEVFGYDVPFEFKWIGHLDEKGKEVNSGKDALSQAAQFLIGQNLCKKNVLLFDCDTSKQKKEENNVYIRVIQTYDNAKKMKKGIENALVLDTVVTDSFYSTKTKEGDYGESKVIQEFNKMGFCEYICSLENEELKSIFANLKTEIDLLVPLFCDDDKE